MRLQIIQKSIMMMLSAAMMSVLTATAQQHVQPPPPPQPPRPLVTKNNNVVFTAVEHPASFPGGVKAFLNYLSKSIKYPAIAREKNIQGKVYLSFVVERDGALTDIKVVRGIGAGCDEEAVKAVKSSPKWQPGTQNGKIVRSQFTMPIAFTLAKA